jgi:pyruvate/2-oxoglutarate/acetoin dehydrogenase E1 component
MKYYDEVLRGTLLLASQPNVLFLGQSVCYQGHALSKTIKDVEASKKLELPVFEETQMGLSIGLAMAGVLPVSIYPRFNFLLLATNQLVNHLDKISHMSHGGFEPKVIIKTMVGSERPLYPGVQHVGNFSEAFKKLLTHVVVEDLIEPEQIYPAYESALARNGSTLIIEHGDYYNDK